MKLFSKLLVVAAITVLPIVTFAEVVKSDQLKTMCLDSFLKDADKSIDPEAYKAFSNITCTCSGILLDGKDVKKEDVIVAMGSCMQATLLRQTMDSVKSEDPLTEDKIKSACMQQWKIFTSFKPNQGTLEKTCACSAQQIMALDADKRNDNTALAQIGMSCAGKD